MEPIVSGVGVVDKSMAILAALEEGPCSLSELVAESGLNRATAHRLALALEKHGMIGRSSDGRFTLGFRLVGLAGHVHGSRLAEVAQPVLDRLRSDTGESTQLYVPDGGQRVCVAAAESPHSLRTIVPVGQRLTMGLGSAARVLSGEATSGRAVASVAERQAGVASVSAPVRDSDGRIVAAVSVSGPIDRTSSDPGVRYGERVVAAAIELEGLL